MSVRETKLIVVTGRKRIGKSNETLRILYNNYIRGTHARKVLIFDPNNEYGAYELYDRGKKTIVNVAVLGHNDILRFNKQKVIEIRRIVPINKFGYPLSPDEQDDLIVKMMTEFRGGCLWIEDLNTVFGDSLPKKVSGFFSNNAHRDCDIIMQMQSIGRILPKMWQNTQVIRFHAQLDSVDQSKNKLKEDYEIFKIAQLMVNFQYDNGNVRFFVYVDKEDKKIRGAYSRAMFEKAVMDYLGENDWLVKKEMNRVDFNTGKKKFTAQQALDSVKQRIIKEYCTV
jgi:hypothetical protein